MARQFREEGKKGSLASNHNDGMEMQELTRGDGRKEGVKERRQHGIEIWG